MCIRDRFIFLSNLVFTDNYQKILDSRKNAITNAIEKVSNVVVGVNVTKIKQQRLNPFFDPFWDDFFPQKRTYKVESFGSGVIISSDGYIVTNQHVVQSATEIIITMVGGEKHEAKIIGIDELTDIALLKIEKDDLPQINIGDSDKLIIGEWAIALGNPLGLFNVSNQATATVGIISGINMDFGQKRSGRVYQNMIQTDASINPGNSGGALVNAIGELIGINTFIMTGDSYSEGSIGIGFAIPINLVMEIINDLKNKRTELELIKNGVSVTGIEMDTSAAKIARNRGIHLLEGDATEKVMGRKARIYVYRVVPYRVHKSIFQMPNDCLLYTSPSPRDS